MSTASDAKGSYILEWSNSEATAAEEALQAAKAAAVALESPDASADDAIQAERAVQRARAALAEVQRGIHQVK